MKMIRLTEEQVMILHSELVKVTGGTDGIRDEGLFDSAVNAPFQSFGGYDVYPSIEQKAARLAYSLVSNHAFIDGNKRISALIMLVFLALNGIEINCTEREMYSVFMGLADSKITFDDLVEWIMNHEVPRQ